jgi:hypothetical protein
LIDAEGVDHVNPKSWIGNVCVGDVDVIKEWKNGCDDANDLLVENFGPEAKVDFVDLFSKPNVDLMRPCGDYVGSKSCADDDRSEKQPETASSET